MSILTTFGPLEFVNVENTKIIPFCVVGSKTKFNQVWGDKGKWILMWRWLYFFFQVWYEMARELIPSLPSFPTLEHTAASSCSSFVKVIV